MIETNTSAVISAFKHRHLLDILADKQIPDFTFQDYSREDTQTSGEGFLSDQTSGI